MIKGLQGINGVQVDSGNNSLPYHAPQSGDSFSGVLRINGSDIQYYSNGSWINLPTSYATVKLDGATDSLLQWCRLKQTEEYSRDQARKNLEAKAKTHPSLERAFAAIVAAEQARDADVRQAQENFLILEKLIGEEQNNYSEAEQVQASP